MTPFARELPALPMTPFACEFPVPERAFAAAFSLKHGRQNLARLLLALRPHRLKFWHFFPFIAFLILKTMINSLSR
jgi:hypothetical protein